MSKQAVLVAAFVVLAIKLALAAHWSLLADEAYYWVWSLRPQLGYYDQPPLIALLVHLGTAVFGDTELGVRVLSVLCTLGPLALLPFVADAELFAFVALGAPVLAFLTWFGTPDAPLLACWSVALAGALRGGRDGWLVAGLFAGLAFEAKYTAAAILPLAIAGAPSADRRTPWPWVACTVALIVAAPNLAWNVANGGVAFAFQLHEGLVNQHVPGVGGVLREIGDQIAVLTPISWLAGLVWGVRALRSADRVDRMLAWSSVPLLTFFAVCGAFAPAEAHWPAPAYLAVAVGLSRSSGRVLRAAKVGAPLGAIATVVLTVHAVHPIFALPDDPGTRLTEGPLVADGVAEWALPEGSPLRRTSPGDRDATPVYTERYQEAALVHFYAGIPAKKLPGCGRRDQYDLWDDGFRPDVALMVRPSKSGDTLCSDDVFPDRGEAHLVDGIDAFGRRAGRWQVYEVAR